MTTLSLQLAFSEREKITVSARVKRQKKQATFIKSLKSLLGWML